MSRGFVKEGDQEEPLVIPPRAILPDGVINYVTPVGFEELQEESSLLEKQYGNLEIENEIDLRREQNMIHGKIKLLKERIASARIINPEDQAQDEVRFGAQVKYKNMAAMLTQVISIVGVDEADVSKGKIAFTTPIAKALAGAKKEDVVEFKLGNEIQKLKILEINY
ncbi:GreA/GreB family elongation factor [Nonlabens marinus]|uniref:Transcription elongation factor GreB n=1 Tax=Nonlabens marinus S1-08 TaxID=1454201 RepID=W8VZG9_9FLAO|nr:GreA/GreB family elongation factor [Nonlabens marinus]BAO54556.1 transcription elongation factor GreB [Nonlabens marinus S1-08]